MLPTPVPTPVLVQVLGEESNFWDSPFILGLLPLAGVVVGTLLGYYLNKASEKRKAAEAKAQRWDQNVLDHTSTVVVLARKFILDIHGYHATLRTMALMAGDQAKRGVPVDPPPVRVAAREVAQETYETLLSESVALRLVAPKKVRTAVATLRHHAGLLFQTTDQDDFDTYGTNVRTATEMLEEETRKHFGIS